ncbi:MAG: zinc ribbon domain-containing protein [Clostridia bacterium]|nr:zinc ribbon domain-containing protein [Clostridia bacterium]
MKCKNCGAEIGTGAKFCEFCGSQISYEMQKEQERLNKQGCPKCGSSNIMFNREKQAELKGKKGTSVVRNTVGICNDCGFTWYTNENASNNRSKTWPWVLGWIFIFPVPVTILMLRKKDMKPALKYGVIAAAWLIFILLALLPELKQKLRMMLLRI